MPADERRGFLRRRLAALSIRGLTRSDRSIIVGVLDEYAAKTPEGGYADPSQLSELEVALLSDSTTLLAETKAARDRVFVSSRELAEAKSRFNSIDAELAAFSADRFTVAEREQEAQRRSNYELVQDATRTLLGLKESVEGQMALRRFLAPWLAIAVDILVFTADTLLFWQTFMGYFDVGYTFELGDLVGIASSLLLSLVGPTLVIVAAVILARMLALHRARIYASELGVAGDWGEGSGDHTSKGALARLAGWSSRLLSSSSAGGEAVAALCVLVLSGVSLVYVVTFRTRLELTGEAITGELAGSLNIFAILFLALPVAAFLAHAAASNPLKDAVEEAEVRLEIARSEWMLAKNRLTRRSASLEERRAKLTQSRDAALAVWSHAYDVADARIAEFEVTMTEVRSLDLEARRRLLALERGLNDRLPLSADATTTNALVDRAAAGTEGPVTATARVIVAKERGILTRQAPPGASDTRP